MLTLLSISSSSPLCRRVERLYVTSFPANERRPFSQLLDDDTGHCKVFAFLEEETFCGFFSVLSCMDIAHITFFAVEPSLRGKGVGSAALRLFHSQTPNMRVIVDIERPDEKYEDNAGRESRKRFYLHLGYEETDVKYRWQDEDYEILSFGGNVTNEDFHNFWRNLRQEMADSKASPF